MSDSLSADECEALFTIVARNLGFTDAENKKLPQSPNDVDNLFSISVSLDRLFHAPSDIEEGWPTLVSGIKDEFEFDPAESKLLEDNKSLKELLLAGNDGNELAR